MTVSCWHCDGLRSEHFFLHWPTTGSNMQSAGLVLQHDSVRQADSHLTSQFMPVVLYSHVESALHSPTEPAPVKMHLLMHWPAVALQVQAAAGSALQVVAVR